MAERLHDSEPHSNATTSAAAGKVWLQIAEPNCIYVLYIIMEEKHQKQMNKSMFVEDRISTKNIETIVLSSPKKKPPPTEVLEVSR